MIRIFKNILVWLFAFNIYFGIFNGFAWYCQELKHLGTFTAYLFSICTVEDIINNIFLVGAFYVIVNYRFKTIVIIIFSLIFLKITINWINIDSNLTFDYFKWLLLVSFGEIVGLLFGLLYFQYIKNKNIALTMIVLIWISINLVYPTIC